MAIKKIRMRPEGGNDYADILHPETSLEQVQGLRINSDLRLEYHNGVEWTQVKGGGGVGGQSTFAGDSTERIIPHGLQLMPTSAGAFPMEDTQGFLGEIWVRFDATNLYVGNTGSYTGAMSWIVVPNVEE